MIALAMGLNLDPTVVAVIGTLFGASGLKIIEHWLSRSSRTRTERNHVLEEVRALQDRLDKVEAELDEWRDKYYASQEQILLLKAMLVGAGIDPNRPL